MNTYIYTYMTAINEKGGKNLKESKEEYMRMFEGNRGKEKMKLL